MDTPKDKRVKREIANSNERRRMQSINAGFQKLKRLLPVNDGEKLSKASILQHAADFIQQIQRDKLILHEQNTLFRGILIDFKNGKDISTATDNIDSIPIIPIGPTSINVNNNNNNTSNNTNNKNNNGDSNTIINSKIRKNATKNSTITITTTTTSDTTTTTSVTTSMNSIASNNIINTSNISSCNTTSSIITPTTNKNKNYSNKNNATTKLQPEEPSSIAATEIISDKIATANSKNGLVTGIAKAAIALPLEVPYISETAIRVEHHHHHLHHNLDTDTKTPTTNLHKKIKNDNKTINITATSTIDPKDPATKGQNLDTICQAIIEIEGDRVFTNENIKHEQHR